MADIVSTGALFPATTMKHALQANLPGLCPVTDAIEELSSSGAESRGAIYTRREVVDFILDLAGYDSSQPLHERTLLEPSFGDGDFLIPVVERLVVAAKERGIPFRYELFASCITAVELHRDSFLKTSTHLVEKLHQVGFSHSDAVELVKAWLHEGDFLLTPLQTDFDFVVGNPPYVRQELIPGALLRAYRALYATVYDRADLYVPFIEKSLGLLGSEGVLAFICSDRWMKNRYGSKLRKFVSDRYHLRYYVDMVDTQAFIEQVIAYPAITVIARQGSGLTRIASRPKVSRHALSALYKELTCEAPTARSTVAEAVGVVSGESPWLLEVSDQLALMRRLEAEYPLLEETGCLVGIGVATGADKAFIGPYESLDVEPDRKLPLVKTKDIQTGSVRWGGLGVINPFGDDGGLVNLEEYPRLKAYLADRQDAILRRNVARKNPANWYRTIDRIYPKRTTQPKLLIPDIKGSAHVVYEEGNYYPHHNLYYLTADEWDLRALRAVLMSGIALLFVGTYSTVMQGGFLRFQAQYLRRIRVPRWQDIPEHLRERLIEAGTSGAQEVCNTAVIELYRLTPREIAAMGLPSSAGCTDVH